MEKSKAQLYCTQQSLFLELKGGCYQNNFVWKSSFLMILNETSLKPLPPTYFQQLRKKSKSKLAFKQHHLHMLLQLISNPLQTLPNKHYVRFYYMPPPVQKKNHKPIRPPSKYLMYEQVHFFNMSSRTSDWVVLWPKQWRSSSTKLKFTESVKN